MLPHWQYDPYNTTGTKNILHPPQCTAVNIQFVLTTLLLLLLRPLWYDMQRCRSFISRPPGHSTTRECPNWNPAVTKVERRNGGIVIEIRFEGIRSDQQIGRSGREDRGHGRSVWKRCRYLSVSWLLWSYKQETKEKSKEDRAQSETLTTSESIWVTGMTVEWLRSQFQHFKDVNSDQCVCFTVPDF